LELRERVDYTVSVATPSEKGNVLEAAVKLIENLILSTSPALKEKPFLFESKKIINVNGVHHEIDIFVTIDLGDGYKSVFIFECKNWQDAVGKNEVIIFEKKIEVTHAQSGYFVAKSFTKDAESQAATNERISLLIASEHDPTTAPLPFGFHGALVTPVSAAAELYARGGDHSKWINLDFETAVVKWRGNVIDFREYLCKWAEETSSTDVRSFRSERVPDGMYERMAKACREFAPGELTIDGREMERAESSIRYSVKIVRPAVVSYFEVESRGRVVSLAPVQIPSGPMMQIKLTSR
jgi:hypothetical protein